MKHNRNKRIQFWKQDNCPKELNTDKFIKQKLEYIHQDPVVARIVDDEGEYLFSSAGDYEGRQGLLKVECI